jgi:hypothetical protein
MEEGVQISERTGLQKANESTLSTRIGEPDLLVCDRRAACPFCSRTAFDAPTGCRMPEAGRVRQRERRRLHCCPDHDVSKK